MKTSIRGLICLILVSLIGCATIPPRGVRTEFKDVRTRDVSLVSVFPSSTFGLAPSELEILSHAISVHLVEWFRKHEVNITTELDVKRHIRTGDSPQDFWDAMPKRTLDNAFETRIPASMRGQEVDFLRGFQDDSIKKAPLLFVELVYYTEGECRQRASGEHVVRREMSTERACLVTHLRAKLVDPNSATTMWDNHVLVERYSDFTAASRNEQLADAVDFLLSGKHGLLALIQPPGS